MATLTHIPEIDFDSVDTSRFEYFDGTLSERPVPKNLHTTVQSNLVEFLGPKARQLGCRMLAEFSLDKESRKNSEWMTPDVLLVHRPTTLSVRENALYNDVELAVEVLSPEQSFASMARKIAVMRSWGVKNIWVIDPESQRAMIYSEKKEPVEVDSTGLLQVRFRDGKTSLEIPLAQLLEE